MVQYTFATYILIGVNVDGLYNIVYDYKIFIIDLSTDCSKCIIYASTYTLYIHIYVHFECLSIYNCVCNMCLYIRTCVFVHGCKMGTVCQYRIAEKFCGIKFCEFAFVL